MNYPELKADWGGVVVYGTLRDQIRTYRGQGVGYRN